MRAETEKRFARVQEAARLNLAKRMHEREEIIISRLVTAYRGGKLTSEMLFGGIAAISELRSISLEAERDQMQAADDATHLFTEN